MGKATKAIIGFYDEFGFHNNASDEKLDAVVIPKSNNTKQFYDMISEIGDYLVVVPNYFGDTPLSRGADEKKVQEWWDSTGKLKDKTKSGEFFGLPKALEECRNTVVPYVVHEYPVDQ